MKLLLTNENIILDFGSNIVYAKGGAIGGGLQECSQNEATHIWNIEKNTAYMANKEISGVTLIEVPQIPEYIEVDKYKYVDGNFIENEDYTEYHSPEDRISALEDMVNMILMGGM